MVRAGSINLSREFWEFGRLFNKYIQKRSNDDKTTWENNLANPVRTVDEEIYVWESVETVLEKL